MLFWLVLLHLLELSFQECTSKIFCQGELLDVVQKNDIFPDSKTFVDLKMRHDEQTILRNFEQLMERTEKAPSAQEIKEFVLSNFAKFEELGQWTPADFQAKPKFLEEINSTEIRDFAQSLVNIWPTLARKMKPDIAENPDLFSLIPVKNGFIIPGGRFREFYYWDTYWIIEGLLLSEMYDTVEGMLDNFISLVKRYQYVPNGSRIYYLSRTQPPLLTLMVDSYLKSTNNTKWLKNNIQHLEQELEFYLKNMFTPVVKNGTVYRLAHYVNHEGTPRPESYHEDIQAASPLDDQGKIKFYNSIKSATQSGWDFSSRWIVDEEGGNSANLSHIQTERIIPVDLNAFLCQAFRKIAHFHSALDSKDRSKFWLERSKILQDNIEAVFYDDDDGIWYDYDKVLQKPRKYFYPSNFAPLWSEAYAASARDKLGERAANYLEKNKILDFDGGIPTSLVKSGQQWDYPNAWPPLQNMVIFGLDKTGNEEAQKLAAQLAKKWVESNLVSFDATKEMFEKYTVEEFAEEGGGGEYEVQTGFGWSNGVILQLIERYFLSQK